MIPEFNKGKKGCKSCYGSGRISIACPEGRLGCAVYHFKVCECVEKEPEHISKPIERVMARVWKKYEAKHGRQSDQVKGLAEMALKLGVEK